MTVPSLIKKCLEFEGFQTVARGYSSVLTGAYLHNKNAKRLTARIVYTLPTSMVSRFGAMRALSMTCANAFIHVGDLSCLRFEFDLRINQSLTSMPRRLRCVLLAWLDVVHTQHNRRRCLHFGNCHVPTEPDILAHAKYKLLSLVDVAPATLSDLLPAWRVLMKRAPFKVLGSE